MSAATLNTVMPAANIRANLRGLNAELTHLTTNKYHPVIPLVDIDRLVTNAGFQSPTGWTNPIHGVTGRSTATIHRGPDVYLHISWHRMGSGNFEVIAYTSVMEDLTVPDMDSKAKNQAVRRGNHSLDAEVNKKYHRQIPIAIVAEILEANGFDGDKAVAGIYVGNEGRIHQAVGSGVYLTMSWYRMPSNNYEITAYLS